MSVPLRVLVVEDSEDDTLLLIEELRDGGYEPKYLRVETREQLAAALGTAEWDVIIADYSLPQFTGLEALRIAYEQIIDCLLIIVSGQITEETAVEAMRSGARDYILKNNLTRLVPAIQREMGEMEVRRQRRQAEAALARSRSELEEALAREQHFSLLLQRALLPDKPNIGPEYDVAAEYVPMYSSREIGGDFYDVFRTGDSRASVLIGDVSGKGLEAAAMAAATRSTIHAFVHETASTAEALTRANSVLYSRQSTLDSFVTVFLATIDIYSGRLTYSSAGHPPPLICRADGNTDLLEYGDTPLAVRSNQLFSEHYDRLEIGNKLVMYTDGISEARVNHHMLDIEGTRQIVEQHHCLPAHELAHTLVTLAMEWAGGKLADDAAVVVTERLDSTPLL